MAKKDHGFTCTKHWNSVLVDKTMIIHRIVHYGAPVLCDSPTFDDGERLYDRVGVKTLTPIDINFKTFINSTHLNTPSSEDIISHMFFAGYTQKEIATHLGSMRI